MRPKIIIFYSSNTVNKRTLANLSSKKAAYLLVSSPPTKSVFAAHGGFARTAGPGRAAAAIKPSSRVPAGGGTFTALAASHIHAQRKQTDERKF